MLPDVSVWVVDGQPDYHEQGCTKIEGADSESIPLAQAVEDGFRECSACTPVPGLIAQVWVIDGRPDYHRKDCSRVSRGAAEEVPRAQAVQDGFSSCDLCHPDAAASDEGATTDESRDRRSRPRSPQRSRRRAGPSRRRSRRRSPQRNRPRLRPPTRARSGSSTAGRATTSKTA